MNNTLFLGRFRDLTVEEFSTSSLRRLCSFGDLIVGMTRAGLLFLAVFFHCAAFSGTKRFFCDDIFIEWDKDGSVIDTGQAGSDYWDRVFYYKDSGDSYSANFPLQTDPPFEMRRTGELLHGSFQTFAGKKKGHYREEHTIYRLNTKTGLLIKSRVHYTSKEDYEENFKLRPGENPYAIPFSRAPLEFVDIQHREGFMKFGYDKSAWRCREVSHSKYLFYFTGEIITQILGI